jgi:DNA invertase Pin-like site-specific DNA recombinase
VSVYGYCRVSTGQEDESLGLAAQEAAILSRFPEAEVRVEVASGGRASNRTVLQGLLGELGRGNTLTVLRLDRLTRSLQDFANIVAEARKRGWQLVVLDGGFDMTTATGRAMAGMLAVFAEFEREMIAQRTREGLAVARERGWDPRVIPASTRRVILRRWRAGETITAVTRRVGLHRESVVRVLRQELGQPRGRLVRPAG